MQVLTKVPPKKINGKMVKPRAAVVGSGFGGLSAAIRLQNQGFDVTVFEKNDRPGGRAYLFEQDGFKFDAGPTVITAPDCIEELFELSGKKMGDYVQLVPIMPFYRLFFENGYTFDYDNNWENTVEQIRAKNPPDVEGYEQFLKYSKEVFDEGYTKLAAVPFLNLWSMIKVAPQLVRLGAHRSVYNVVSRFIKDPELRQAFSFHSLLVGGNPYKSSAIYTLIHFLERNWGVYYSMGGTHRLVMGLVKLLEDLGGEVRLESEVDAVTTATGKVSGIKIKGQEPESFDLVVSNAEVMHTYRDLLKGEEIVSPVRRKLAKMDYSMSLFLIYFGTNKKFDKLSHHNVIFGPRYKGLLEDIFKNGVLADDFSLYLHAPSLTDPSIAPEGCQSMYLLSPVPHLGHLEIDWSVEGPKYAKKIFDYLEEKYMPGLQDSLVTQKIITPDYFKDRLNSHLGAAFSVSPTLTQSAYFRLHNKDKKLKGMYFVGAGTHPGAGVPGVINSAKATADVIRDDIENHRLTLH